MSKPQAVTIAATRVENALMEVWIKGYEEGLSVAERVLVMLQAEEPMSHVEMRKWARGMIDTARSTIRPGG